MLCLYGMAMFSPLEQLHLYFFITLSASVSGMASSSFLMDTRLKTDLDPEETSLIQAACCPWLLTPVFANSPPLWWADILGHCANVKSRTRVGKGENVINLFPKFASITLFQTCPFLSARWPLNWETRINGFRFQEHLIKVSSKENTNTCKRNHQATFPGSLWIYNIHSYISPRNRCNALNFK